jgi:HlyD family secretion protein
VLGEAPTYEDQELITGRGVFVPVRWSKLSFHVGGPLEEIQVTTGMTVTAGQVLATLEHEELELQVRLAQNELQAQEAQLAELEQGVSQAEIDAAQAGYEAATAALEEVQAGPSDPDRALAEAELKRAETALQRAQSAYDAVSSMPDIGSRPQALQLEQATIDMQRAEAAYELALSGPSEAMLLEAQSRVASAKAQLEALTAAQPYALQAAQAGVTRARLALEQANLQLEQTTLYAPFDGTITSMEEIAPGDMVGAGTPVLTLADLSELQVEITDLDEWGAANVTVDQTVDLLVPALANRSLRGKVTFVATEPTLHSSGAVFYKAIASLDRQDPELRWGYSTRIRLYVAGAHGVGFR